MRKLIVFALLSVLTGTSNGYAKEDCLAISKKQVKIELMLEIATQPSRVLT